MSVKWFPSSFDPESPLPGDGEKLLRSVFSWRRYVVGECDYVHTENPAVRQLMGNDLRHLLDQCDRDTNKDHKTRECRFWMLMAHVNTDDIRGARELLNYWWNWGTRESQPRWADISKFVPGSHYHCLGVKFDTMKEAKRHIEESGFRYGTTRLKHVYATQGD